MNRIQCLCPVCWEWTTGHLYSTIHLYRGMLSRYKYTSLGHEVTECVELYTVKQDDMVSAKW